MELLITIAYIFLIRLIFFDYKLLKFNLFWKLVTAGIYVSAAMTEVLLLGQITPYSKTMFVQSYVVQMAPEYGGLVKEVFVSPNQRVKKGDPLFQMDPEPWQNRMDEASASLTEAKTSVAQLEQQLNQAKANVERIEKEIETTKVQLNQISNAASQGAASQFRLEQVTKSLAVQVAELEGAKAAQASAQIAINSMTGENHTLIAKAMSELANAEYNLKQSIIRAPSDGYVANHQLYPGAYIRLKQPVLAFVNSEEMWMVATIPQRGIQHIEEGDSAILSFEMYPGKIFEGVVENVVWAAGEAQGVPSGHLPHVGQMKGSQLFTVRLRMKEDDPDYPLQFGASGTAAMISKGAPDFLVLLRQIEVQSESFLDYLYNPFK